jgi:hypothetical protein
MMKLYKNAHGNWVCESHIDLTDDLILVIYTSKRFSGNLVTTAQVHKREGEMLSHAPFSDFNKTLISESRRATMKATRDQHEKVFFEFDTWQELRYQAIDFYNQPATI